MLLEFGGIMDFYQSTTKGYFTMALICIVGQKRAGKDTIAEFIGENEISVNPLAFADPVKDILGKALDATIGTFERAGVELTRWHFDGLYYTTNDGDVYKGMKPPKDIPMVVFNQHTYDREQIILLSNRDVWNVFNQAIQIAVDEYGLKSECEIDYRSIEQMIMSNKEPWSVRRFLQVFGTDVVVNQIDKMFWVALLADKYIRSSATYSIIKDVRQSHEIDTVRKLGGIVLHVQRDGLNNDDQHISERTIPILEGDHVIENNGTLDELRTKVENFLFEIRD